MRNICFIFLSLLYGLATAQNVRVNYEGDVVSDKDRRKIERMIGHEVVFYARFGLPDTLIVRLHVFNKKKEGQAYLREKGISVHQTTAGLYSPQLKKAFIIGREKGDEQSLKVIYHEMSHHFTREILGGFPPTWLNEGLAEYFDHCEINKKGVITHELSEYEQGRIRTMYMLDEVDLPLFVNRSHKNFMHQEYTDESYSYILAHALAAFWVEKVPDELFEQLMASLQNKGDMSTVSERIERIYPGGFTQFEADFALFCE